MLNTIWAIMILIGIVTGILTGKMEAVGNGALEAAGSAVTLCITMMGILSMWTGLMQVAKASGLLRKMSEGLAPLIRFLYPKLPEEAPVKEYIATNMVANILGLGWAATPAGLNAMKELEGLRERRGLAPGIATNDMCNFLILNISSLQLIPVNLIAYRSSYGSENPAGIIAPAILATLFSTVVAVVFICIINRFNKEQRRVDK